MKFNCVTKWKVAMAEPGPIAKRTGIINDSAVHNDMAFYHTFIFSFRCPFDSEMA